VRAEARERDIGTQLGEIARPRPDVAIGSYPFFDPVRGNVVLRAREVQTLARTSAQSEICWSGCGAQSSGA
jgi:hypothetical protein